MPLTPRETARRRTLERIRTIGFRQLDEGGPEALNLRAIARELGIVPSGLYRYVPDRDALITLLIVDAYETLAQTVLGGDDDRSRPSARLHALVSTMRRWALEHPRRWALIYGTPLPNYHAPAEQTNSPGSTVASLFLQLVALGDRPESDVDAPPSPLSHDLVRIAEEQDVDLPASLLEHAVGSWISILGLINAEVFGYLGSDTLTDFGQFTTRATARIADQLGLE